MVQGLNRILPKEGVANKASTDINYKADAEAIISNVNLLKYIV